MTAETTKERTVTVSVGYERKVSINYQTWVFTTHYSEPVTFTDALELTKQRKRLRLRAMAAVYADVLNDFDRIAFGLPNSPEVQTQAKNLRSEAEAGVQDAVNQLAELEK